MSTLLVNRVQKDRRWVEQRRRMEAEIAGIMGSLYQMEATHRAVVITQNEVVGRTYRGAESSLNNHLSMAKALAISMP
ncbi:MAG TPA: hypothetical protein VEC12_06010, partial [Bacteroidia bacterium]|nr:hypothetical protein [Bacteroidia bacterium]